MSKLRLQRLVFFPLVNFLVLTAFSTFKLLGDEVLFEYAGKKIARSDLEPSAKQELYSLEQKSYEQKKQVAQKTALDMLIKEKMQASKKSREDVEKELFKNVRVDEKDAKSWYEENKASIGGQPYDPIKEKIIGYLTQMRRSEEEDKIIAELSKQGKFVFALKEPIPEVVAIQIPTPAPSKGAAKPVVSIVEFADYRCGHCQRASLALKKIVEKFKDKVQLTYLDFPLQNGGLSTQVAYGGFCALAQGKFWEYHYMAFEGQNSLNNDSPVNFAKALKLDEKKFSACLNSEETIKHVATSRQEGERLGISGTPAIYLNGVLQDNYEYANLEKKIEKLL